LHSDLYLMITPQQIYEQTKNKTRVVILGSERKTIVAMILHVLAYHERKVDVVLESAQKVLLNDDTDFVIIEANKNAYELNPNIALLSSNLVVDNSQLIRFINAITNGGILVYNEENTLIKQVVEESAHPIQKYPYETPKHTIENNRVFLDTNEGKLPLEISSQTDLQNLAGVKWICQHMAIDENDFYEAIGSFERANCQCF